MTHGRSFEAWLHSAPQPYKQIQITALFPILHVWEQAKQNKANCSRSPNSYLAPGYQCPPPPTPPPPPRWVTPTTALMGWGLGYEHPPSGFQVCVFCSHQNHIRTGPYSKLC